MATVDEVLKRLEQVSGPDGSGWHTARCPFHDDHTPSFRINASTGARAPFMKLLWVNEVARELGVSEAWLRRAEKRGRIPRARRDLNGWRVYAGEDIAPLREVLLPSTPDQGRHNRGGGQDAEERAVL